MTTDVPLDLLLTAVFWNALAFAAGWLGEQLLHRWRTRRSRCD
jgi:hypothetical protein